MEEWQFFPKNKDLEPFPALDQRLQLYHEHATLLSIQAIGSCIQNYISAGEITALITVSCTGMSAPGLDISIMDKLNLPSNIYRSSVNFMGCYAAIHALKMADNICRSTHGSKVLVVCTELCTIHFQKDCEMDSIASGLLFADGSAAVLVTSDDYKEDGLRISNFYSEVALKGQTDMAWHLSGKGFLMHLSAYIPQLLQAGISPLLMNALKEGAHAREDITRWAIHPGGRKILESICKELGLEKKDLHHSFEVLRQYGNMSSPTILFILKELMTELNDSGEKIFTAAFGPGLTMETLILEK